MPYFSDCDCSRMRIVSGMKGSTAVPSSALHLFNSSSQQPTSLSTSSLHAVHLREYYSTPFLLYQIIYYNTYREIMVIVHQIDFELWWKSPSQGTLNKNIWFLENLSPALTSKYIDQIYTKYVFKVNILSLGARNYFF